MVQSLLIDDLVEYGASRLDARTAMEENLKRPFVLERHVDEPNEELKASRSREEFYATRDKQLRSTWGHDPDAQAAWDAGARR